MCPTTRYTNSKLAPGNPSLDPILKGVSLVKGFNGIKPSQKQTEKDLKTQKNGTLLLSLRKHPSASLTAQIENFEKEEDSKLFARTQLYGVGKSK